MVAYTALDSEFSEPIFADFSSDAGITFEKSSHEEIEAAGVALFRDAALSVLILSQKFAG